MYVEEFFRWGWQETDQKNDDGIDGFIIARDHAGVDLGAMIKVQVKSGPSYLSSRVDNKAVRIAPYSDKNSFKRHLDGYSRSNCPVILIWVNTQKIEKTDKYERVYEDKLHPEVWWRRIDDYKYMNESVVTLDRKFGEHSKGDLYRLIKNQIKGWLDYPELIMDDFTKNLYYSLKLKEDALEYYRKWNKESTRLFFERRYHNVKVNRTGWRHVKNYRRGMKRVNTALKLLPLAKQIIETPGIRPVLLNSKTVGHDVERRHYGLRCRVSLGEQILKVQVVLIRMHYYSKKEDRWRFYSLHVVK